MEAQKTQDSTPRSEDAERGVLSCFLQSPEALLEDASESIPVDSFYHYGNRMLYEELLAMHSGKKAIDLVTLSQHLIDRGLMDKLGGPAFLAELLSFIPTAAHYPMYKGILKDKMTLREVIAGADRIRMSALENQEDIKELEGRVLETCSKIESLFIQEQEEKSWDQELDEWRSEWEAMASGKKESAFSTQWPSWNRRLAGIASGYTIISGESSSGKSALLGNIFRHSCIDNGMAGLWGSYEMPVRMNISRLIADIADVDGMYVFAPDKTKPPSHITRAIAIASQTISKSKLRIIHNPTLSADGLCRMARKMHASNPNMIMGIDYCQIVPIPAKLPNGYTREREVAANSEFFRCISKELDIPVIMLSQLNIDGSTRESSGINMDADSHLKCDRYKDKKTGKIVDNGIFVYKNRNGERDFHLPIHLTGPRFRFEEHTMP